MDSAGTKFACFASGETYQDSIAYGTASTTYQCKEEDIITTAKRDLIVNDLMPTATSWLSRTLSVRPVQGPLKLTAGLPNSVCYQGDDRFGFTCCEDQVLGPHKEPGIADTDYVVHITARPFRGSVVAWAYPCNNDQYGRPVAGQINFVPSSLSTDPAESRMQFIKTLHELFHNLGFSSDFFPQYRRPGSLTEAIGYSKATKSLYSQALQKRITTFVMDNAMAKLKEHFDCQNWPTDWGVELENDGGGGTAGKHVEERLFYNELMSGWVHANTVPSAISLSFLQDSGWYQVSYDLAEKLFWGNAEGCSFAQDRCSSWNKRYFCSVPGQSGCTPDLRSKALCNAYELSGSAPAFESQFQYFADNPRKAGKFPGADHCPVYEATKYGECTDQLTAKYWYYGEYTGVGARCFMGTYQVAQATAPLERHGGCALAECDTLTNRIRITLSRGQPRELSVLCPASGGDVDLGELSSEWAGSLECPRSSVLCSGDPCDVQDCSGHGVCQNSDGSCVCEAGFYGDDAFRCDKQRCPANADTGVECSGNGNCNPGTGQCTGSDGLPGCFPGFKAADCSQRGCPDGFSSSCPSASVACECSGRGACNDGVCECNTGYIASDCGLTDCPLAASNGERCGGVLQGTCDVGTGVCQCSEGVDFSGRFYHYSGADCDTMQQGPRLFEQLYFSGEPHNGTETGAATLSVAPKSYAYFQFSVPSVEYDLALVATRSALAPLSATLPTIVAAYETQGLPTLSDHQFRSTQTSLGAQQIVFRSDAPASNQQGQDPSRFSDVGTMRVALLGYEEVLVDLELRRDACAVLQCSPEGTTSAGCVNNECQCRIAREQVVFTRTYGYAGLTCGNADCPGQPDCGGARGTCKIDRGGSGMPVCECRSIFTGEACQRYSLPIGTSIFAASVAARPGTSVHAADQGSSLRTEYRRASDGVVVSGYNSTFTGLSLAVGETATPAFVDPLVAGFWGNGSTISYYAKLTVKGGDIRSKAPAEVDPALLSQKNDFGSLNSYLEFDRSSWISRGRQHEIIGAIAATDYAFFSVLNGRYATTTMEYDFFLDVSSNGCPQTIHRCSGHGVGDCKTKCTCQLGWTGVQCEIPLWVVHPGSIATTAELSPGAWSYMVVPVPAAAKELTITATLPSGASPASKPKLLGVMEATVSESSIGKLSGESARFDYAAAGNASQPRQSIRFTVSNPQSQRFVVVGLTNLDDARAPATITLRVEARSSSGLPDCANPVQVASSVCTDAATLFCSGHGELAQNNGEPFCDCDPGWDSSTSCASPHFASLNNIASAAQGVEYVCTKCSEVVSLKKDDFFLFKSPQPVQAGATVSITVAALDQDGLTESEISAASGGARSSRRAQPTSDSVGSFGNPSILVSETLPRSIADFRTIVTTRDSVASRTLSAVSASGKYFIAVYANRGGNFSISLEQSQLVFVDVPKDSFIKQVTDWVFGTTRGNIAFAVLMVLFVGLASCCLLDFLAPRCLGRLVAGRDVKSEQVDEELAVQMQAYQQAISFKSSRFLLRASSRHLGSPQSVKKSETSAPSPSRAELVAAANAAAAKDRRMLQSPAGSLGVAGVDARPKVASTQHKRKAKPCPRAAASSLSSSAKVSSVRATCKEQLPAGLLPSTAQLSGGLIPLGPWAHPSVPVQQRQQQQQQTFFHSPMQMHSGMVPMQSAGGGRGNGGAAAMPMMMMMIAPQHAQAGQGQGGMMFLPHQQHQPGSGSQPFAYAARAVVGARPPTLREAALEEDSVPSVAVDVEDVELSEDDLPDEPDA